MKVLVGSIQRFCLTDGPGIRTTVFFKGCSICCPWCCNPENLRNDVVLGKSGNVYGRLMSEEEIASLILRDKHYYYPDGGVTFSGGECLLTLPKTKYLIGCLKNNGVNIAVETSLFVPTQHLESVIENIDSLYVDFKILLNERASSILSADLDLFLQNLDCLKARNMLHKIHPRFPLVPGFTDDEDNINSLVRILKEYNLQTIEIFSVHNIGSEKYKDLGIDYVPFQTMSDNEIERVVNIFESNSIQAKVLVF